MGGNKLFPAEHTLLLRESQVIQSLVIECQWFFFFLVEKKNPVSKKLAHLHC
jgi:hypothetical protein